MGENNSKPEKNILKNERKKLHSSHVDLNAGTVHPGGCYPKGNYSRKNLETNNDSIQTITQERVQFEKKARVRLPEKNFDDRFVGDKQRRVMEQRRDMKKQQEILNEIKRKEKMKSNPKNEGLLQDMRKNSEPFLESQIAEADITRKQSEALKNRKKIEKQLLENLMRTEMAKLKLTIERNSKPFNHQHESIDNQPNIGKNSSSLPDIRKIKIKDSKQLRRKSIEHKKKSPEVQIRSDTRIINDTIPNTPTQAPLRKVNKRNFNSEPPPPYSLHPDHSSQLVSSCSPFKYQQNNFNNQPPPAYSPNHAINHQTITSKPVLPQLLPHNLIPPNNVTMADILSNRSQTKLNFKNSKANNNGKDKQLGH